MSLSVLPLAVHNAAILPAPRNAYGPRVSLRRPNPLGKVMVLMYHHTGENEKFMFRSYANFRSDLQRLYEMHYRPVTMQEFVTGTMPLAPGASPVVFTFDDGHRDQFNVLDDGTVDPKSFVGMWLDFAKTHPDFPVRATFYVNKNPWNQPKVLAQKVKMLKEWGSEVGSHTMSHPNLKKLSDDQVKKEMAECYELAEKLGFKPNAFAYPFGNEPRNMKLVTEGFSYNGKFYKHTNAVLAGASPSVPIEDSRFSPYRIQRVQAFAGEGGSDYYLGLVQQGKSAPYVQP